MMAVAMQPIPGRPARHEEYDGSHGGTPRAVNGRLTQVRPRPLRMTALHAPGMNTGLSAVPVPANRGAAKLAPDQVEPVRVHSM